MEQLIAIWQVFTHPLMIGIIGIPLSLLAAWWIWNKIRNQSYETARDWAKIDRKRQKAKEKEEKKKQSK